MNGTERCICVAIIVGAVLLTAVPGWSPPANAHRPPVPTVTLSPGEALPACGVIAVDPVTGDEADRGYC